MIRCGRWLKSTIVLVLRVITRIKEANGFLLLKEEQKGNSYKWLYPIVEYVDLNRQGLSKNETVVRFAIDSALLYPIDEYLVSMKLCLRDTVTLQERETEDWHAIKPYPPIRPLERHHFCENIITFEKEKDNTLLLEMMERFRNGYRILAVLKIGIRFKKEDKPILLEGSHWVMPMNNYRGD